tara:strand:- start:569 stop:1474 length:906 start_codon:yes stop_codon:yes gene_type:complete
MKQFIQNIVIWVITILNVFLLTIGYSSFSVDNYAIKVMSDKKQSLIIGDSRALVGISPNVLSKALETDFFNYAFNISASPYGPIYFNSIINKINSDQKNNIHIISVSPWSISSTCKNPDDSINFREHEFSILKNKYNNSLLGRLKYYFNEYNGSLIKLLYNYTSHRSTKNGHLIHESSIGQEEYIKKRDAKVEFYKKELIKYEFSPLRFSYLNKIIDSLKDNGKVFLVRLPVDSKLANLENQLIEDFDNKIESIASKNKIEYLNFHSKKHIYSYSDGHHLSLHSALSVSDSISKWIEFYVK